MTKNHSSSQEILMDNLFVQAKKILMDDIF